MSDALRAPEELLAIADAALATVPAGTGAEAIVTDESSALTRYANGAIHQSVASRALRVRLRLVREGRTGVAEARSSEPAVLARLAQQAEALRRLGSASEDTLASPQGDGPPSRGFVPATAGAAPEDRADAVATVCSAARARGQLAYGACETAATAVAVVSTTGVRREGRRTLSELIAVTRADGAAAFAARHSPDLSRLDPGGIAEEVTERCARGAGPRRVEPGTYEVILSPYAVAEMLEHLAMMGLTGLAVAERRSFMRPGERLMSPEVTIRDDATDPALGQIPFDAEGITTEPVTFVDHGVCSAVVHDGATARRAGTTSTGHAQPQPTTGGPVARALVMEGGGATLDELIRGCRRGLLITRFWYVRPVHPVRTIITGMTREGTFLVEDGAVTGPVRDLRFTQGVVEALDGVVAIGRNRLSCRGYDAVALAPWLHLQAFSFTS